VAQVDLSSRPTLGGFDRGAISVVVDLGCGTGRFSEMLAAEFGARVIGLDPSEKMIDQARRKLATSPVVFGRASAHELPLPDGCVDLVFMSQIYHHLPDPAAVARECQRVLRVGGYVCIRTGTRDNDVVVPNFFRRCGPCLTPTCRPAMRSGRTLRPSRSPGLAKLCSEIGTARRLLPGASVRHGVRSGNGCASRSSRQYQPG
jgi:SAM-dependent methyltransferase